MNGAVRRAEWRTEERRSQVAVDGQTLAGRFSADARYQLNTSRFIQRTGGGRFFMIYLLQSPAFLCRLNLTGFADQTRASRSRELGVGVVKQ